MLCMCYCCRMKCKVLIKSQIFPFKRQNKMFLFLKNPDGYVYALKFFRLRILPLLGNPLGLLSLSTLNSFLSVPKPSAPWTSMAVSFQHPLSCLSQLPSTGLKGPLTAHIPPLLPPAPAAAQPWSLPHHSHSCGVLAAHLPEPPLPTTAVVWILFGLLPWLFGLQVQPETPNLKADLFFPLIFTLLTKLDIQG